MDKEQTLKTFKEKIQALEKELEERKLSEETLQESEAFYKAVIEQSNDAITVGQKGRRIFANKRFLEIFGYTDQEEVIGKELTRIVHPDSRELVESQINDRINGRPASKNFEFKGIRRDDILVDIEISTTRVRFKGDYVLLATMRDITKKKNTENKLKKSEMLLRNTFDAIGDLLSVYDRNLRIVFSNWHAPISIPMEKRNDKHFCYALFMGRSEPCDACHALEVFETGRPVRLEKKIPNTGKTYEINAYPVFDENNEIILVTEHVRDITERFQAVKEKEELEKELLKAHKMEAIGTIAGGIAHDFNNILGIILGNTELVLDDTPVNSSTRHNLDEIKSASLRAKDAVQQLLSFSRKSGHERRPLKLTPILKESLKLLRASIPASIEIRHRLDCIEDLVLADLTQIQQVLINLCTNARDAMREKGGLLNIQLENVDVTFDNKREYTQLSKGKYVQLSVRDTGHGITKDLMPRIFDPYFTTKKVGEGTGMGLSVVHGIVKNHDGETTVFSEPEKGTVFNVFLPVVVTEPTGKAFTRAPVTGSERI